MGDDDKSDERFDPRKLDDSSLARWLHEINSRVGRDNPWIQPGVQACFLCGARLTPEILTEEHLIPQWLIRRYNLLKTEGSGPTKRYVHPLAFTPEWQVPDSKLTVPACHNCNSGYLLSVERQIKKMLMDPAGPSAVTSAWHLTFWFAKVLWGLHWFLLERIAAHGEVGVVSEKWSETRVLRQCLQVLMHRLSFADGSGPASGFLYRCQVPQVVEDRFDFQVSLPLNTMWMRIDGLIIMMAFDLGWQRHWQSGYFSQFGGMNLHPWQAEEIGALFFNAAQCRPRLPQNMFVVHTDRIESHVLAHQNAEPLEQDTDELMKLLTVFLRCSIQDVALPNGMRHTYLRGDDGSKLFIDIKKEPWRRHRSRRKT